MELYKGTAAKIDSNKTTRKYLRIQLPEELTAILGGSPREQVLARYDNDKKLLLVGLLKNPGKLMEK